MSKPMLRNAILILGLITGVIHTIVLPLMGFEWLLMPLNGIGFIVLTGLVYFEPAFLSGQRKWVLYGFMVYTLITIVGYFVVNLPPYGLNDIIGLVTKVVEVLLLVALWLYKDK
ncbi:MAG: hypothetical protein JW862_18975 [Anaerolineales bacterium]|nr:hypothetical protein [Anaerolineales bacterium]